MAEPRALHRALAASALGVRLPAAIEGFGLNVGNLACQCDGIAVGERVDVGYVAGIGWTHLQHHRHVTLAAIARGMKAHDGGVRDLPVAAPIEAPFNGGAVSTFLENGVEGAERLRGGPA